MIWLMILWWLDWWMICWLLCPLLPLPGESFFFHWYLEQGQHHCLWWCQILVSYGFCPSSIFVWHVAQRIYSHEPCQIYLCCVSKTILYVNNSQTCGSRKAKVVHHYHDSNVATKPKLVSGNTASVITNSLPLSTKSCKGLSKFPLVAFSSATGFLMHNVLEDEVIANRIWHHIIAAKGYWGLVVGGGLTWCV